MYIITTADKRATQAGFEILKMGGSAVDAAITAQMMLTLVEPHASGIGGGLFLVYYDSKTKKVTTFNGREKAPKSITPNIFMNGEQPLEYYYALTGGKSVGVPGVVKTLENVHKKYGNLKWENLFESTINMAKNGFEISPKLHVRIRDSHHLFNQDTARNFYYDKQGKALPVGYNLKNLELAKTMEIIAKHGSKGFYEGEIANNIINAVKNAPINPSNALTKKDFLDYDSVEQEPISINYRGYKIYTMAPPSGGGMTILQILGMLENIDMGSFKYPNPLGVHYYTQAASLAYADRAKYIADPEFVKLPKYTDMLSKEYLKERFNLINKNKVFKKAPAGIFEGFLEQGDDQSPEWTSTSHLTIIDKEGNAVSMTTTIEHMFGSALMVDGFILNNELTDFSLTPVFEGKPVANAPHGGKRPSSSMCPTLIFDENGLYATLGSPGGSQIPNYVAKTIVAMLDWGLPMDKAIALSTFSSQNKGITELEEGIDTNIPNELKKIGHSVEVKKLGGNLQGIQRVEGGWKASADPRGEGESMGG